MAGLDRAVIPRPPAVISRPPAVISRPPAVIPRPPAVISRPPAVDRTLGCGDHNLVVATRVWHTAGEHGSLLVLHRRGCHALGETDSEGRPC